MALDADLRMVEKIYGEQKHTAGRRALTVSRHGATELARFEFVATPVEMVQLNEVLAFLCVPLGLTLGFHDLPEPRKDSSS